MKTNENKKELKVFKLHLELDNSRNLWPLMKYGKVNKSISRDILVCYDYPLHALHYVIQQLFGWSDSHLHHFQFSKKKEDEIINDKFGNYCKLCGILFRPFYDDFSDANDIYENDNYDGNISFKSWLRMKYNYPFEYDCNLENYLIAQKMIRDSIEKNQELIFYLPYDEYIRYNSDPDNFNIYDGNFRYIKRYYQSPLIEILERLSVNDVLSLDPHSVDELIALADSKDKAYDEAINLYNSESKDSLDILSSYNDNPVPVTNKIKYLYDYGDDWKITITLKEVYELLEKDGNTKFVKHNGKEEKKLKNVLYDVIKTSNPRCINADGLSVMDDVGGIYGYCNFLININDADILDEDNDLKEWANDMGWDDEMPKVEMML